MRKNLECDVKSDLLRMKMEFHLKSKHPPYTVVKQDDDVWGDGDFDEIESPDIKTGAVGPWGSFWIGVTSSLVVAGATYLLSLM